MGGTIREADWGQEHLWGIDVIEFVRKRRYLGGKYLVSDAGRARENGVGAYRTNR